MALSDSDLYRAATEELIKKAPKNLYAFMQLTWPVLHDGRHIIPTWHVPLMCRYLEAVASRTINRLVICIPPGFAKSLTVSVVYSSWRWLDNPNLQITSFGNSRDVVVRDSRRVRKIIKSDIYRSIMGEAGVDFDFADDQNEKKNFELTTGGFRQAYPIGGSNTGKRSDEQLLDDLSDASDALESPELAARRFRDTRKKVEGTLSDRLNSLNDDPRIMIAQRLHPLDAPGGAIDDGWPHLVLPMEYDPDHPQCSPDDPRTQKGELLCPALANRETVERLKRKPLAGAKLQQMPEADGEDLFTADMFLLSSDGQGAQSARRYVISCDPTGGGGVGADPSGMVVWADCGGQSIAVDVSNSATDWESLKREFFRLREKWGARVALIEKTGLGPSLISEARGAGMVVHVFKPGAHGGKYARANVSTERWRDGSLRVRSKEGLFATLIDQHCNFPNVLHDDLVDACSQYAIWRHQGAGRVHRQPREVSRGELPQGLVNHVDLGY